MRGCFVRCSDGVDARWPWAEVRTISLRSPHVAALVSRSAVVRAVSHARLLEFQVERLYPTRERRKRAQRLRRAGSILLATGLADLACGLGERRLVDACNDFARDPAALRQALLDATCDEGRWEDDLAALEAWTEASTTALSENLLVLRAGSMLAAPSPNG